MCKSPYTDTLTVIFSQIGVVENESQIVRDSNFILAKMQEKI